MRLDDPVRPEPLQLFQKDLADLLNLGNAAVPMTSMASLSSLNNLPGICEHHTPCAPHAVRGSSALGVFAFPPRESSASISVRSSGRNPISRVSSITFMTAGGTLHDAEGESVLREHRVDGQQRADAEGLDVFHPLEVENERTDLLFHDSVHCVLEAKAYPLRYSSPR